MTLDLSDGPSNPYTISNSFSANVILDELFTTSVYVWFVGSARFEVFVEGYSTADKFKCAGACSDID